MKIIKTTKRNLIKRIAQKQIKQIFVEVWFAGNIHKVKISKTAAIKMIMACDEKTKLKYLLDGEKIYLSRFI